MVAAARSFWAVPAAVAAGRQRSRQELAAVHRVICGLAARQGLGGLSGDGREGLVAELLEEVVAAFEQLARERETGAVRHITRVPRHHNPDAWAAHRFTGMLLSLSPSGSG